MDEFIGMAVLDLNEKSIDLAASVASQRLNITQFDVIGVDEVSIEQLCFAQSECNRCRARCSCAGLCRVFDAILSFVLGVAAARKQNGSSSKQREFYVHRSDLQQ
ncbi:hypothetical protein ASD39_25400 [Sphingomonas sp. Root50]|nr:hypothetical protein ASD17_24635 [Sphingomonas sp. Root1294]KQY69678.1 hypothetical protein ASD39_25400 [Sphingomonas sp. Root50]KRB93448.1 hypothetical protein ASE22_25410 [Sphingomonas sp. Root720]